MFDPRGGGAPESYGVNRNLLVSGNAVDPLSQTVGPEFGRTWVIAPWSPH